MASRQTIFELPINQNAPIYSLTPDPLSPSIPSFLALSSYTAPTESSPNEAIPPSMSRRSRQIKDGGTFSYSSPLPIAFPYDIGTIAEQVDKVVGKSSGEKVDVETTLASLEPSLQHPVVPAGSNQARPTAFTSPARLSTILPTPTLLSFSRRTAAKYLPQLDAGDAGSVVQQGEAAGGQLDVQKRNQLVDVLGGRTVLARSPVVDGVNEAEKKGFAPWSLCYAGHQFGFYAGQLGDGRAISILSTPTTEEVKQETGYQCVEMQLKGAGRTPYSRFADGLAVLRSSVREYLGAESMGGLGLPTSRCLALVGIPDVKVRRERIEGAAIVTRLLDSWIRIGSFEMQANRQEWESLRLLTRHAAQVLGVTATADSTERQSSALAVLTESARRNAMMNAGWQSVGFCHGVLNTDNIALVGSCIDYGPYAFMDVFDPHHVCNHSDEEGRYSFTKQPEMVYFAINKLGEALAPIIGCELSLGPKAASGFIEAIAGWSEVDATTLNEWNALGMSKLADVKSLYNAELSKEYARLSGLRLGLLTTTDADFALNGLFLDLMALHNLDFSSTYRLLAQFTSVDDALFPQYLEMVLPATQVSEALRPHAVEKMTAFFKQYEARLNLPAELAAAATTPSRAIRQNAVNPRFVLRQWVLEEIIAKLDTPTPDLLALDLVLEMASEPYRSYGEVILGEESLENGLEKDAEKQKELCGMGNPAMLGFQCSCSS